MIDSKPLAPPTIQLNVLQEGEKGERCTSRTVAPAPPRSVRQSACRNNDIISDTSHSREDQLVLIKVLSVGTTALNLDRNDSEGCL